MKVVLLNHTNNAEETIAMAAKLCYSPSEIEDLKNNLTPEKIESFIKKLVEMGHESPLEHVTFTFGIEGISRACSHQLVRHRIASYSQQSQRYVDGESFDFVVPPSVKNSSIAHHIADDVYFTTNEVYDSAINHIKQAYIEIRDDLFQQNLNTFLKENNLDSVDGKTANMLMKKACEDARYILPNACTTKIICTFNVRSLWNFFKLRLCNRAQWEIREVAEEMLKLCLKESPLLFSNCAPSCVYGKCGEGKMTCGKSQEVREKYKELVGNDETKT